MFYLENNLSDFSKKIIVFIVLLFLVAFHLSNNYYVSKWDTQGIGDEELASYVRSVNLKNMLFDKESFEKNYDIEDYGLRGVYPPLFRLNAVVSFIFLGETFDAAVFSISFFYIILIIFSYKLMRLFAGSFVSLLMCAYISFVPGVYRFSRVFLTDFILTAMTVAAAYYLLLLVQNNKKRDAFLLGFFCSLGLLSKQSFVFIFLPFVILKINKIKLYNLIISAIVVFCLAVPWHLWQFYDSSETLGIMWNVDFFSSRTIEFFRIYSLALYENIWGTLGIWVAVSAVFYYIFFLEGKSKNGYLLWFLFSFSIFLFCLTEHATKYILPLCVPVFLIIATVLIRMRSYKKVLFLALIIVSLVINIREYIFLSYPKEPVFSNLEGGAWGTRYMYEGVLGVENIYYNLDQLLALTDAENITSPAKIAFLFSSLEGSYIKFYLYDKYKDNLIVHRWLYLGNDEGKTLDECILDTLKTYDFLLLKPENATEPVSYLAEAYSKERLIIHEKTIDLVKSHCSFYKTIEVKLNDTVFLYDIYLPLKDSHKSKFL